MSEPPCFEGRLHPNHYLKCVQDREGHVRAKGQLDEEDSMVATRELYSYAHIGLNALEERDLQKQNLQSRLRYG